MALFLVANPHSNAEVGCHKLCTICGPERLYEKPLHKPPVSFVIRTLHSPDSMDLVLVIRKFDVGIAPSAALVHTTPLSVSGLQDIRCRASARLLVAVCKRFVYCLCISSTREEQPAALSRLKGPDRNFAKWTEIKEGNS